jgi:hypothetical protein
MPVTFGSDDPRDKLSLLSWIAGVVVVVLYLSGANDPAALPGSRQAKATQTEVAHWRRGIRGFGGVGFASGIVGDKLATGAHYRSIPNAIRKSWLLIDDNE